MATARSFGNYDLAAALADLIDNSIKAQTNRVDISFIPSGDDVLVSIRDDGLGMDGDTLINAMKPASAHPDTVRAPNDLGRFGWGLKTASLSQARIMTVISWQNNEAYAARWNIDDIDDWSMEYFTGEDALKELSSPVETISGTEVIWSRTDRLVEVDGNATFDESLTHLIAHAQQKLSLIFHRYLSGHEGKNLIISINNSLLKSADPFMQFHNATQTLDAEIIKMGSGSRLEVQPYVLPHFSKLTVEEQNVLGGPEGMIRNQGFYVYRNRRLIIHGTWFRLVPHGELSQLTRVRVDLPNTMDHDWRITVDKSGAQLPTELKRRLREVIKRFNRRSYAVHRKKGVSLDRHDRSPVWLRIVKNGHVRYRINREHPMVSSMIDQQDDIDKSESIASVLTLLESYFPTDRFVEDASGSDNPLGQSLISTEEFDALLKQCLINYAQSSEGMPKLNGFLEYLRPIEPFASQWRYTEDYIRNKASTEWGILNGL